MATRRTHGTAPTDGTATEKFPTPLRKGIEMAAATVVAASRADRVDAEEFAELADVRATVERTRQMLEEGQAALVRLGAIHDYLLTKVTSKYAIGTDDRLMSDGSIQRAAAPETPAE